MTYFVYNNFINHLPQQQRLDENKREGVEE